MKKRVRIAESSGFPEGTAAADRQARRASPCRPSLGLPAILIILLDYVPEASSGFLRRIPSTLPTGRPRRYRGGRTGRPVHGFRCSVAACRPIGGRSANRFTSRPGLWRTPMSLIFRTSCVAALALATGSMPAAAQVPRLLGFQGRLLRADGTAATGTASVSFSAFSAETGGTPLWTETQTLGLSDGYYSTFLGLVAAPAEGLFDSPRWLEIKVGAELLSPRQKFGAVAFALTAQSVAGGSASVSSLRVGGQTVVDETGRLAGPARYSAGAGVVIDAAQVVSLRACATGQVLLRGDGTWDCANPGTVTSVAADAPLSVSGGSATPRLTLSQAGAASAGYLSSSDWTEFSNKYGSLTQCGGDLAGPLSAPTVARLQSRPVSGSAPLPGQVLKWVSTQWEPAADSNSGGTVTAVTGHAPLTVYNSSTAPDIYIAQAGAGADGFLSSGDWTEFSNKYGALTQFGGDLRGVLSSPIVARIQGVSVATDVPSGAQVLRFDGTDWRPASLQASDVGGLSAGFLDLGTTQTVTGAKSFSAAPSFGSALSVASGGTGSTAFTAGGILYGGPAVGASAAGTSGQVLVSGGAGAPSWSGAPTLNGANFTGIPMSSVTDLASDLSARPTGSGAAGYLSKWSGGAALESSSVYDTGSAVGIGTSEPGSFKLLVNGGPIGTSGFVSAAGKDSWYNANIIAADATGPRLAFDVPGVKAYAIEESTSGDLVFDGGRIVFRGVTDAGNVGIGVAAPVSKLQVAGQVFASGATGGSLQANDSIILDGTTSGSPGSCGTDCLRVYNTADRSVFNREGTDVLVLKDGGSVGIGTTSPSGVLHVQRASGNADMYLRSTDASAYTRLYLQNDPCLSS